VGAALGLSARRSGRTRSLALGVATGAVWALTTNLLKATANDFGDRGLSAVAGWAVWALIAGGAIGTIINQTAFQSGDLVWSLPAMSVVEPLLASAFATVVFGERMHVRSGLSWLVLVVGSAAALVSVAFLGHHQAESELSMTAEHAPTTAAPASD
jgi:hypothetical protein